MNDKLIDDIRLKMQAHEVKAPEGLLDDVKAEMSRRGLVVSPVPCRHGVSLPLRIAVAAAAAVALLLWIVVPRNEATQPVKNPVAASKPAPQAIPEAGPVVADSQQSLAGAHLVRLVRVLFPSSAQQDNTEIVAQVLAGQTDNPVVDGPAAPQPAEKTDSHPRPLPQTDGNRHSSTYYDAPKPTRRHSTGAFSTGAFWGGGMVAQTNGGMGAEMASDVISDPVSGFDNFHFADSTGTVVRTVDTSMRAKHHQPFKAGVSVRYRLGDRWSLQSGVSYSYLQSDLTYTTGATERTERQRLHYVSVPLSVGYSIVRTKRVDVYATAGVEAAKLVSGKREADGSSTSVSEHRLQYSANAAVGAEYHFGGGVSAYVEPGVSHYFDNHSSVVNIYKDRPTQFSLNVGLRLSVGK